MYSKLDSRWITYLFVVSIPLFFVKHIHYEEILIMWKEKSKQIFQELERKLSKATNEKERNALQTQINVLKAIFGQSPNWTLPWK